jgi:succinyl-CoA synthetase beta subunit
MWLRDFLPCIEKFRDCRIMTFGYASGIKDSNNKEDLDSWARTLLHQLERNREMCSTVRKLASADLLEALWLIALQTEHRPMLFVAYSLGGLVVREVSMASRYVMALDTNI